MKRVLVEVVHNTDDGRRPTTGVSRLERSSGNTSASRRPSEWCPPAHVGTEADAALADTRLDHLVEAGERTTTDNRMLVVSIWMNSWCGCLRPPWADRGGHALEDLEQRLLPSPETRVIDGFSALRAILSISSCR
jgi:hypothetical protein